MNGKLHGSLSSVGSPCVLTVKRCQVTRNGALLQLQGVYCGLPSLELLLSHFRVTLESLSRGVGPTYRPYHPNRVIFVWTTGRSAWTYCGTSSQSSNYLRHSRCAQEQIRTRTMLGVLTYKSLVRWLDFGVFEDSCRSLSLQDSYRIL